MASSGGSGTSAPRGSDAQNSVRRLNQAVLIGNSAPPNMSLMKNGMLSAASPSSLNLVNVIGLSSDTSDAAARSCRSYKDIDGLRNLQKDQSNKTHYDAGCGWRYKPSNGINPEINQAALGSPAGPSFGGAGSPDEVSGGTQWFWNLADAEKTITAKICQNVTKCSQLKYLGKFVDVCGYCKSTGTAIPIVKGAARYPNDNTSGFACPTADIVTATRGTCPPGAEGFVGNGLAAEASPLRGKLAAEASPLGTQGDLREAFAVSKRTEAFTNLTFDDLDQCEDSPLSRDCVVLAARMAGCHDGGTLIQALNSSPVTATTYDSVLRTNPVFSAYTSLSAAPITRATLADGSVALTTALDDFGNLMKDTTSPNQKLSLAAKDLCVKKGSYEEYDFCTEISMATVINRDNFTCAQKLWKYRGGTESGTAYPVASAWIGKTFGNFYDLFVTVANDISSNDKAINARGINKLIGLDSGASATKVGDLPMDDNTRGAETVWFDLTNNFDDRSPVVILRCDLSLAKDTSIGGKILPFFANFEELKRNHRFPSPDYKAFTSAFEIRSPSLVKADTVAFNVTTDDGFMISKNQNPFENTANKSNDWGSWRYQAPTTYTSPSYTIDPNMKNMFVTKWFNGGGQATALLNIKRGTDPNFVVACDRKDLYLTQEPLAPWMQYELCTKPNSGRGASVGFFEKRWNGPSAFNYHNGFAFPSFDVDSRSVVFQTDEKLRSDVPGKKGYMSFNSSSWWHTRSYFHFTAFKTLTLLIRPMATLAPGGFGSVFHHCNLAAGAFSAGLYIYNTAGQYTVGYGTNKGQAQTTVPITMNEWNLVVIQYIGDDNGVRGISFNVETLAALKRSDGAVRRQFLAKLTARQQWGTAGPVMVGGGDGNYVKNSGWLMMGSSGSDFYKRPGMAAWNSPSFTGDVAWVHGFRNYIDRDELLLNEINQTWISRWPNGGP